MKICILGSGAGENYPDPWCRCPNCEYARVHGGKNLKASSAVMINSDLMIDMTEGSILNAVRFKQNINTVKYLLVTHAHSDHFAPNQLWHRLFPETFARVPLGKRVNQMGAPCVTPREILHIYGTRYVGEAIEAAQDIMGEKEPYGFVFHPVIAGKLFTLGGYEVKAIGAHHGRNGYTLNYILRCQGLTLMYALDTGGYDTTTLEAIKRYRYDCIIMEATHGLMDVGETPGHMNIRCAKAFFEELRQCGSINSETKLVLSHLSPHWTPPHDLLEPILEKEGIVIAYDGQIIELKG